MKRAKFMWPCNDCSKVTYYEDPFCHWCGASTAPPDEPGTPGYIIPTAQELRNRAVLRFPAKNDEEGKS